MKKIKNIFVIVSLFFMMMSLFIRQSKFDKEFPPDFQQFAYSLLIDAEELLKKNEIEEALENYKICLVRASRCGRNGVFKRIRNRITHAGLELFKNNPQKAWKFFEFNALIADDFESYASRVEALYLRNFPTSNRFQYKILNREEQYSPWGTKFRFKPAIIYNWLASFLEKDYYEKKEEMSLPSLKSFYEVMVLKIRLMFPRGLKRSWILIRGVPSQYDVFLVGSREILKGNSFQIKEGEVKEEVKIIDLKGSFKYNSFNAIIIKHRIIKIKNVDITLVREYEKIEN